MLGAAPGDEGPALGCLLIELGEVIMRLEDAAAWRLFNRNNDNSRTQDCSKAMQFSISRSCIPP